MKRFFRSTYFAIILLIIYIPIAIMIFFSFNSGSSVSNWSGFSTKWYEEFFKNSPFIKSIITSLFVAIVSTVISVVIGTMAAIGLSRVAKRKQSKWISIANIPLINADIITAVALMIIFLLSGIKFGIFTLIMAHVSFNVPYVLITVMPRLRKVDKSIVEASYDLGAKTGTVIFKVILPILKPAIIIATVIAFAMSFDDFIISYFTGGDQTNVASFIYSTKRIKPYIFAFGTMMVAIIAAGVIIWNAVLFTKERKEQVKLQIKNGTYKSKNIYKLEKEINNLLISLETITKTKKSKRLSVWFKYYILKLKLKLASSKNYDKKIAKLEWKRYKLQNTINREKRYGARLKKAKAKQKQLEKQISKSTDIKRAAKLSIQLEKVEEKITFLSEEIAWITQQEKEAIKKAASINKKIKQLKKEFKAEVDPSKKTVNWYNKKIKYYEEWKIEVEEGKNNFKLRMIVEKLKEVKQINENKITDLAAKLDLISTQAFRKVSVTSKINKQIMKNPNDANLKILKEEKINSFELTLNKLIESKNEQISKLKIKISKEKEKYFPTDIDEANFTKGFFARTWKIAMVTILALVSFTGLTVAYVMNNIYDLVIGNWGEYIDTSLIKEFEEEYGVRVNYQVYDSNETLYNKLYTFSYDLMVPSDYMVQKLANEGKLEALDYSRLNVVSDDFKIGNQEHAGINRKPAEPEAFNENETEIKESKTKTISKDLLEVMTASKVDFVEDNEKTLGTGTIVDYSIPYLWGDLIIVVNPNSKGSDKGGENVKWLLNTHPEVLSKTTDGTTYKQVKPGETYDENATYIMQNSALSWGILWDAAKAGKEVILNEDPKNVFAIAGQKLFGEGNFTSKESINAASNELKDLLKYNNVALQGDLLIENASEGKFDFAVMYNGDAALANRIYNGEEEGGDGDGETEEDSLKRDEREDKINFLYGRPNAQIEGTDKFETTNIYSDNLVMARNSSHKDVAYDFINFYIQHAQDISEFTGTPTGFVETLDAAVEEGGMYEKYKTMFLPIILHEEEYKGNLQPFFNNNTYDPILVDAFNMLRTSK
ncbi:spermidine/putrescine ABC transporter permease/substrate-binding protein [Mesoplasma coleopterae]|uniref:spermidine/putrescine ABC transporter permease/substrate-binding protein n=1 Tax=Mesoplasma coleopterae TaxID=324078 RepID=UPI000D046C05|nr:spermidine/putrescine ABC transporter permease/substrate-binding protein [Mesoplasma coleopterae]AVN63201.1 spermidine/putrescine ABC transporter permease [Mesoplasma coleopterae]